jgi:hypothetical protein
VNQVVSQQQPDLLIVHYVRRDLIKVIPVNLNVFKLQLVHIQAQVDKIVLCNAMPVHMQLQVLQNVQVVHQAVLKSSLPKNRVFNVNQEVIVMSQA